MKSVAWYFLVVAVVVLHQNGGLALAETISSCKAAPKSGVYQVKLAKLSNPLTVLCEMDAYDGGWTVFQQRLDGSVDFNNNFQTYRDGFGTVGPSSEFWLGLEPMHQLTESGVCELAIDMKNERDKYFYARYTDFGVGAEDTQYTMTRLGAYTGDTSFNALSDYAKGGKFYTKDKPWMNYGFNLQTKKGGGWWINSGFYSYLNGEYDADNYSFFWQLVGYNLKYSRMMMRCTP